MGLSFSIHLIGCLEKQLFTKIEELFGNPEAVKDFVTTLNERLGRELNIYCNGISTIEKDLASINGQI